MPDEVLVVALRCLAVVEKWARGQPAAGRAPARRQLGGGRQTCASEAAARAPVGPSAHGPPLPMR
eukprot:10670812-Alexandrium_andersonii.AAC.1